MADATLIAQRRTEAGKGPAGRIRVEGLVPAIVYGLGGDNVSVAVSQRELIHILSGGSGMNTLITLSIDGSEELAIARELQRHPVKGNVIHVDFVRVRADQTIEAEIPIQFLGEAEGVRNGGLFEQSIFAVTVEALPGDIPNAFEHDISEMVIGDAIHVGDLSVPAGVVVLQEPEAVVAHISLPRAAEEEAAEPVEGEEGEAAAEGGEAPAAEDAQE
jgi:large subunit ribosomal protein L25